MRFIRLSAALVISIGWLADCARLVADDLLPSDKPIAEVVDFYVTQRLQKENLVPADGVDDANFIRRVTLDLTGRIPTPQEADAFVRSTDAEKRSQLVDRLLASPDFAYHQRNEFDSMLMPVKSDSAWREYLLKAMQENRTWPQLFREMMTARDDDAALKPALAFLKTRAMNVDDLTNDTSKLFFGVSISCAKCHDHPLVLDWTQDHYFGLASFFNRTYITRKNNFLGERNEGQVKFKTTAGVEKDARLMFLTGQVIDEPPPPEKSGDGKSEKDRKKEQDERETPPDPPAFSRRAKLVEAALAPDPNGFFPRSFVNRVWNRVFGYGLVMPVDQMHSANDPSHPELLSWLARDVVTHDYDLKRLVRGLVLSETYARSSLWTSGERPAPKLFAVGSVRPLTPMQYSLSLLVATSNPEALAKSQSDPETWEKRRKELEGQAQGFASQIELPGENFQVSVSEALLFSNSEKVQSEYLRDASDRLVGTLKALPDRNQQIQTAFTSVLSRSAQTDEVELFTKYLDGRNDRMVPGVQQLVWTLITSGEFRFNY